MIISPARAEKAKSRVAQILKRLLGPNLEGVVALGVRFDVQTRDLCVGVDLEPGVASNVIRDIPHSVASVPVQISLREPLEMD